MSAKFKAHIRTALDNPNLQAALDYNAERRRVARQQGYASLPEDLQTLRRRAHALRAATVAGLEGQLAAFIARVEANGITVHRAANATEANEIIVALARRHPARTVAKAKTMVGEEIRVNAALEEAGIRVVETDLGEYIVQLRGERPAHILTPAVHLRRRDVGRTFAEKLGLPYTEDVEVMTAAARRILRQVFLEAEVGITGVNFGVVETGTLCLVTNEGNGRLVSTLPRAHIALMGIERLVPTLDDLSLMLALLPRSGSGQKLTVYTSLIHSPRRPGELDGPDERHLVLVDNGRSALRQSPLAEALYCIRCGACLNACPVFREIGGHAYVGASGAETAYPGPIGSVVSPGLFGVGEFGQLARASSLCGACKEACPVDIDLPALLLRIRAGVVPGEAEAGLPAQEARPVGVPRLLGWGLRLFGWVAAAPGRFRLAQRLAGLVGRLVSPRSAWLRLPALTGWGASRDFPRPATRTFSERWAAREETLRIFSPQVQPGGQAAPARQEAGGDRKPLGSSSGLERFAQEAAAVGAKVCLCQGEEEAAGYILNLLHSREIGAIQAWPGGLPAGLLAAVTAGGIGVQHAPDPALRAGLTGALAGIADLGALVLPAGSDRPQTASLLPEIHFAVLRGQDICDDLNEALALPEVRSASAVALVCGPSRTGDIEMTLTIGMHGPCEVHIVCLAAD